MGDYFNGERGCQVPKLPVSTGNNGKVVSKKKRWGRKTHYAGKALRVCGSMFSRKKGRGLGEWGRAYGGQGRLANCRLHSRNRRIVQKKKKARVEACIPDAVFVKRRRGPGRKSRRRKKVKRVGTGSFSCQRGCETKARETRAPSRAVKERGFEEGMQKKEGGLRPSQKGKKRPKDSWWAESVVVI